MALSLQCREGSGCVLLVAPHAAVELETVAEFIEGWPGNKEEVAEEMDEWHDALLGCFSLVFDDICLFLLALKKRGICYVFDCFLVVVDLCGTNCL